MGGVQRSTESHSRTARWSAEHSPRGADTRCLVYYNPLLLGAEDFDNLHVRAGTLADANLLYDHPEEDGWTPSNPAQGQGLPGPGLIVLQLAGVRWRRPVTARAHYRGQDVGGHRPAPVSLPRSAMSPRVPVESYL